MPPGTGGLAFQLTWGQQPSTGAKAAKLKLTPQFNACNDFAISTISATVSNGTATVTNSWPCSAHKGLILGVPAGADYTVSVSGISSGQTTWSGQTATPITVTTQQVTSVGPIAMNYVGGDTDPPTVTAGPHSSPTNTTNVPVTDRINIVFSEPMAISTITSTNITLNDGGTVPGTVNYDSASNTAVFTPSANLAYDTQYVLQVASGVTPIITDTAGNSLTSDFTFTFTTEFTPAAAPAAPSGVTATPGNSQVRLDWAAVNGAVSYNVYYDVTSCPTSTTTGTQLADVKAPAVHLSLANGTTYCYVVTAVNGFGESPVSASASATPALPAGTPEPAVDFNSGASPYTISWPDVPNATGYNLYWSPRPIFPDKATADNVVRYVTSPYTHTGVQSGQTYCYIVTAMTSTGESADSRQVCGPSAVQIVW
jgi:hypothetical protein